MLLKKLSVLAGLIAHAKKSMTLKRGNDFRPEEKTAAGQSSIKNVSDG
jgi:hypothetical protein